MSEGSALPEEHHVARGCGERGVHDDVILPAAFVVRPRDRGRLSVDWVECRHAPGRERSITGSRRRLEGYLLRAQWVAVLPVAEVRNVVADGRHLDAIEAPHRPRRPCHAAIVGWTGTRVDQQIRTQLAKLANRSTRFRL
jgi:hypothetical protein